MIFIDYREDALIRLFNGGGRSILREGVGERHAVEVRSLLIGDVWVATDEGVLSVIIERKTLNDLWSSIRDGRFHEQHDRAREYLEGQGGSVRYILLIEMEKTPCDMPREALMTLLTRSDKTAGNGNIMMIRRSDGICETAEMIRRLDDPVVKKTDRCNAEAVWDSISRGMKRRRDAITPSAVLAMLIALTPKVSFRTAQEIAGGFGGSVSDFVGMMNNEPDEWAARVRPLCGRMHAHIIRSMRSLLSPSGDDQRASPASGEASGS